MHFGKEIKDLLFLLNHNFCNMNHGSYGCVPRAVSIKQHEKFLEQESRPDKWFRITYYEYIKHSRIKLSELINCSMTDIVLVENASSAVNSIVRTFGLKEGDKVLRLSTAYGMVIETTDWLARTNQIEIITVHVLFPVKDTTQLLSAFAEKLQQHPDIKLCCLSHISSMPSMVEPVKALVQLVRTFARGCQVLIDGAHVPGQLPLDVKDIAPDYYIGNCHKWLYAPKGTAFLWVSPSRQRQDFPAPTVISSVGMPLEMAERYAYTGTRDYTAFIAIPAAFDFIAYVGGLEKIQGYCHNLAIAAGRLLTSAWSTELLVCESLTANMINVVLPTHDSEAVSFLQKQLDDVHNIYIVCSSLRINTCIEGDKGSDSANSITNDVFFTRLSAQIYLELSDFARLANLVPIILSEYEINRQQSFLGNAI